MFYDYLLDTYGINNQSQIKDIVISFIKNENISFYDSVSFDDYDYEIIDEYNLELKELLLNKKIW